MTQPKKIIAVGGGKGGVGKSLVSANLAIALAKRDLRVVLCDLDLGMANLHTLLGIDKPGPTLHAFFERDIDSLEEAFLNTSVPGLSILPGSGAHLGAANIQHAQKQRLLRQLKGLETDVLLLDCGAGMHYNTLDFFLLADLRVLVLTPQVTSLENAYAFLKVALYRAFRNLAQNADQRRMFDDEQSGRELDLVGKIVRELSEADPEYGARVEHMRTNFGLCLVGNMITVGQETNAVFALQRMIRHFLALDARVLGTLKQSKRLHESVTVRQAFMLQSVRDENTQAFEAMALTLQAMSTTQGRAMTVMGLEDEVLEKLPAPLNPKEALPATLSKYQRRYDRIKVTVSAQVQVNGKAHKATLNDISISGALLVTSQVLQVGDRVQVGVNKISPVAATVRNVRPGGAGFGIEFDVPQVELFRSLIPPGSSTG